MRDKSLGFRMRGGHYYYPGKGKLNTRLVGGPEDEFLMRREGLWLTNGGRVVKPGMGEYASTDFGDFELLGCIEIENGVGMAEFDRRWREAKKKWKKRERERKT